MKINQGKAKEEGSLGKNEVVRINPDEEETSRLLSKEFISNSNTLTLGEIVSRI